VDPIAAGVLEPKPTTVFGSWMRWFVNRDRAIEHHGVLSLRDGMIRTGECVVCARADVANAFIVEEPEAGTVVRLVCRHRTIDLAVAAEVAEDALDLLELGPAHQAVRIADVTVGADGVRDGRRFLSLEEVVHVRVVENPRREDVADVELRDALDYLRGEIQVHRDVAGVLARAVRHAIAVRSRWRAPADLSVLAREDGDEGQWVRQLRELSSREGTYRGASVDVDALAAVVRDPAATVRDRAAAAVATAHLRPAATQAAAGATAHAQLRDALLAALGHDDAELARALRRLLTKR
jgi:hypothetical protein